MKGNREEGELVSASGYFTGSLLAKVGYLQGVSKKGGSRF